MLRKRSRQPAAPWAFWCRSLPASALFALVGCQSGAILDSQVPAEVVVLEKSTPPSETDGISLATVAINEGDGSLTRLGRVQSVTRHPGRGMLLVDEGSRLVLVQRGVRTSLLDGVEGKPAVLPDGRIVASRAGDPGESDLWLVGVDGEAPRALTTGAGGNGHPFVLDDGRVMFLSSRTGVASIFVIDPATGETTQLTNHGERPGRLSERFVPPPAIGEPWQQGRRVFYDAGDAVWSVDVVTGHAEVAP